MAMAHFPMGLRHQVSQTGAESVLERAFLIWTQMEISISMLPTTSSLPSISIGRERNVAFRFTAVHLITGPIQIPYFATTATAHLRTSANNLVLPNTKVMGWESFVATLRMMVTPTLLLEMIPVRILSFKMMVEANSKR